MVNLIKKGTDPNLYEIVRELVKEHCKLDEQRVDARMLRRIFWARAKGEIQSMIYTYSGGEETEIKMITTLNDFMTAIDNFLIQEEGEEQ